MRVLLGWPDAEKSVQPLKTSRTTAPLDGVNKSTAVYDFLRLRMIITQTPAEESPFDGAIEVDESYFEGQRKGKRGRGAAGKVPVFIS